MKVAVARIEHSRCTTESIERTFKDRQTGGTGIIYRTSAYAELGTGACAAILNVWFGGSEAAYAIGDALFGYVNPGGKLTMSFPKNVGQIPLYYAHKNTGRPLAQGKWFEKFRSNYLDVDNEPLYPFGYGLSYTTFSYGDIDLTVLPST